MTKKGTPKRDGSGKGTQDNYNRGGCHDGETGVVEGVIKRQYRNRRSE